MKNIYIVILFAFIGLSAKVNAQIVNIPDTNFYKAIIASGVKDSAGFITVDTAKAFTGILRLVGRNINDLTGIEAFTAIDTLVCPYNNLVSLNLSLNISLKALICIRN